MTTASTAGISTIARIANNVIHPETATPAGGRAIAAVADSQVVMEGAGVPVRRVLPSRVATYRLVDPFLLLDDAKLPDSDDAPSFPPHPHRGFEIITYILGGAASHSDSEGSSAVVKAGGLQRITAGSGMWHGEGAGEKTDGPLHALQLWINLAQAEKRIPPAYKSVHADQIPVQQTGDATVRVLVGDGSPTVVRTPATYLDVTLPASGTAEFPVPAEWQGFIYVLEGSGQFGAGGTPVHAGQIAVMGPGESFGAQGGAQGARFVLLAGRPYRQPVRWNGPFVD